MLRLLRSSASLRILFLAHTQSSLGSGAAYVGLLLLAYDQFQSGWAITLVLLADFLPSMLAGPLFGAAADRWSRTACAVVADLIRAAAFIGLGLISSFVPLLLLALLAGTGSALFRPAVLAGLPRVSGDANLDNSTALYSGIEQLGNTLGPAIAAAVLIFADAEALMLANGITFLASALLLMKVDLGRGDAGEAGMEEEGAAGSSLRSEARAGVSALRDLPAVRAVVLASAALLAFAAAINVAELLLATDELDAGTSGYGVLVAIYGVGVVAGSFATARLAPRIGVSRLYLAGIAIFGLAACGSAVAPTIALALVTFALSGIGEGFESVSGRLFLQRSVPDRLMGRIFAVRDSIDSWAFGVSFLLGGALTAALGSREVFWIAGIGSLVVWLVARRANLSLPERPTPDEAPA